MSKTQTIEVPEELRPKFRKAIEARDRFLYGVCQSHKRELGDRKKRRMRNQSIFREFSPLWQGLTDEQKNAWKTAAQVSGIYGWQQFISDNAARRRNNLTLNQGVNQLWQTNTGHITIADPASEILLKQEHPLDYWVARKVRGQPWKRELVLIKEEFSLPLTIGLAYKSDLTPFGGEQIAKLYAEITTSYQGIDRVRNLEINFSENTDWTAEEETLTNTYGYITGYKLYIHIKGYRGQLLYDNIRAEHGGTNWARDPRCDNVSQEFTKAFAIVRPFWEKITFPPGVSFQSAYPPAL